MIYARDAHATQTYDEYPYFKHLENVYNVLIQFGYDEGNPLHVPLLAAAWLHDVLEDSSRSYADLKEQFGEDVAEIVFCMTDEIARTRKEKKQKTYQKIRSNKSAIIVKVADRIANIEHAKKNRPDKLKMYAAEQKEFQDELRVYEHIIPMWNYLDKLMFLHG
jgi:(p)ppGpp synthase/HD superfamily hydrolase